MSDEHLIDKDLNYDVVINAKKFKNPRSVAVKNIFDEMMFKFFNTSEEMCHFMTEVGKNHPDGVNLRYLIQLMTHYSTSKALSNLEAKGLISSSTDQDGEIIYTLTELGRKIGDELN